ncbi:hypothetical protein KM043_009710 [Ampulex compressa]|nr:hypothetical protein KM043_009710 [Ampulex compressa]
MESSQFGAGSRPGKGEYRGGGKEGHGQPTNGRPFVSANVFHQTDTDQAAASKTNTAEALTFPGHSSAFIVSGFVTRVPFKTHLSNDESVS